tara:strand:- start:677 stop:2974 length:2298 start_codon:yes stop_codon:yes gene_type:complete
MTTNTEPTPSKVGEKTPHEKLILEIEHKFFEYFKKFPNRTDNDAYEQSKKMTIFIIKLYQKKWFSLENTLNDKSFDPKKMETDEELKKFKDLIKDVIESCINTNLKLIYSPDSVSDKDETKDNDKKDDEKANLSKEDKRRLKYQEMVKIVLDKFCNNEEMSAGFINNVIMEYKSSGFDKDKTVEVLLMPFPDDTHKTSMKTMTEKIINELDQYIYLFVSEKPKYTPPIYPNYHGSSGSNYGWRGRRGRYGGVHCYPNYSPPDPVPTTGPEIYKKMISLTERVFGDKQLSKEFIKYVIGLCNQNQGRKFAVLKVIETKTKSKSMSENDQKRILDLVGNLQDLVDIYRSHNADEIKSNTNSMFTGDEYLSDDEGIEKPKILNKEMWNEYSERALYYEVDVELNKELKETLKTGKYGKTEKPPHRYKCTPSIFLRGKYKGTKYAVSGSVWDKVIESWDKNLDTVRTYAGISDWFPINNLRNIASRIADSNQEYIPIAMKLSTLIDNLLEIERELDDIISRMSKSIPLKNRYKRDPSTQTSMELFDEKLDYVKKYINYYTKFFSSDLDSNDDKELEIPDQRDLFKLTQWYLILKRIASGLLIRYPKRGRDIEPEKYKEKDMIKEYVFVMAPYNWCNKCQIFKFDEDVDFKNLYNPLKCKQCGYLIYHLNNQLYFKFDNKDKSKFMIPILDRIPAGKIPDENYPPQEAVDNKWIISAFDVMKVVLNKLDKDPNYIFEKSIKLSDLADIKMMNDPSILIDAGSNDDLESSD